MIRGDQDEVVPLGALSRFVGAPGVKLVQVEGGQHFLGRPPHLDTVVAWIEGCVLRPGRTSPPYDCGRISEVCRRTQSSPEKYVPIQELRTAPQAHPPILATIWSQRPATDQHAGSEAHSMTSYQG